MPQPITHMLESKIVRITMAHINWICENNVWKCTDENENEANSNISCLCGTKDKLY